VVGEFTCKKRDTLAVNRERAKRMRHKPVAMEKLFWAEVRNRKLGGFKFKRQVLIGSYIVDFLCVEERLIVELDGPFHADRAAYDETRDAFLREQGYCVERFANSEVGADFDIVLSTVLHLLRGGTPSP
jgi:very-short-patch-repair endonuclease